MKLVIVYNPNCYGWKERYDLLVESAEKFNLVPVGVSIFDFDDEDRISELTSEKHLIVIVGYPCKDKFFQVLNHNSVTFHSNLFDVFCGDFSMDCFLDFLDLPYIKTVYKSLFKQYNLSLESISDYLGGFPIVLKRSGLSKGEGVFKVDDMNQLRSMVDLFDIENYNYSFKEFYPHTAQGRVIMVGREYVSGHLNVVGEDFRSNVGESSDRIRENHVFKPELLNYISSVDNKIVAEFSGYDLLYGVDGTYKICEKNSPCNFTMTQKMTNVSISDKLIQLLLKNV